MAENDDLKKLILRARAGDDEAFTDLCARYSKLIASSAARYARMGSDYGDLTDDFRQEASLALFRAAKTFDIEQSGVTFGRYGEAWVRNALISQLRKLSSRPRAGAGAKEPSWGDVEGEVISAEMKQSFLKNLKGVLTPFEEAVLTMSMDGLRPRYIASELGTTPRSVSNALYRARIKARKDPDLFK